MLSHWITLALDLVGTFVFALSGALVAVRKGLDLVGVAVLAIAAGLGGGMIRDIVLGTTPPAAFRGAEYLLVAVGAAMVGFFFHPHIARVSGSVLLLDALGLGFCAVTGTAKSLNAGLGILPAVLLGVVSGSGGGVIRDVLGSEIPLVLRRDVYALAALLGATLFAVLVQLGAGHSAAPAGIAATFAVRVLAIRFGWQAPRPLRSTTVLDTGKREPTPAGRAVSFSQQLRDASRDWKTVHEDIRNVDP